jgi:pteridine reductase
MSRGSAPATEKPVALVTGAGRRVGNGIARKLAENGYRLALHSNRALSEAQATVRELEGQGIDAISLVADLRDDEATRRMIAEAHSHFGRLDALVNNAAVWVSKPLEQVTVADVREHWEVNTLATFVCCQQAGLIMVAQQSGGAIVNVGDWAVVRPYANYAAYFASKGAIPTMTRTMAIELGSRNPRVRVNAVLPGPVAIPEGMSPAERRRTIDATLVKRAGTPEDLAHAVLFLLQNTFITGISIAVDGGRSIYAPVVDL